MSELVAPIKCRILYNNFNICGEKHQHQQDSFFVFFKETGQKTANHCYSLIRQLHAININKKEYRNVMVQNKN